MTQHAPYTSSPWPVVRIVAGLLLLAFAFFLARPAAAEEAGEERPANVRYFLEKSRQNLKPRLQSDGYSPEDFGEGDARNWLRVKFQDGVVADAHSGLLKSAQLDTSILGLEGSEWQRVWAGTREERTDLWRRAEQAIGRRLSDPTTYFLVRLPDHLSLSDGTEKLQQSEHVEAVWPVRSLTRGPTDERFEAFEKSHIYSPLDAWKDFGITGRLTRIIQMDIAEPLPNAGYQLPDYSQIIGVPFNGAEVEDELYSASVLSYLGAPIDETLNAGMAPHASFAIGYWNILGRDPETGNWLFEPAQTLEALAMSGLGSGDVLLLNWCLEITATATGQYLGCLPLEADLPTYEAILTLSVANSVAVVQWAGWTEDAAGNILPWTLDGISLPDFPNGCTPLNRCLDTQALVVGWGDGHGSVWGNTGIRLDVYSPEGAKRVAGVSALAQSAVRHIGYSTFSNTDAGINGGLLRGIGGNLPDPVRTIDQILELANARSASLRVHGPLPGFGPVLNPQNQNVSIREGAVVELPDAVAASGVLQFPFKIFNDGRGTLTLNANIIYDEESNPVDENPFSFSSDALEQVPSSLDPREGADFVINFEPRYSGSYEATVEIDSNDSLAQPFRFKLSVEVTGESGLQWSLLDVNDAVLAEDKLGFGQVDWTPLPGPIGGFEPEAPNPPDIHPSRVVKIKNFGGEAIEVEVDIPGASYHCKPDDTGLNRQQNDRPILVAGYHFMNVQPGCPQAKNSLRYVIGGGESETVGFEFLPHEVGSFTSGVTFRAKRYGTSDEEEVRVLDLEGTVRDWPEALKLQGCDGKVYDIPLGGRFSWDLGAVRYSEVEPTAFRLYSKIRGVVDNVTTVADAVSGEEAPVGLSFVKKVMGYLEAAEATIGLLEDGNTAYGNLVRTWQVEVDLDEPTAIQSFLLSYSMRPFVDRGSTTFTLSRPGDRVNVTPDNLDNRCGYGGNKASHSLEAKSHEARIPPGYVHDFGAAAPGSSVTETYVITNTSGTNSLRIREFLVEGTAFTGSITDTDLGPGESTNVEVSFRPGAPGSFQGWLSFEVESPGEVSPFWIGRLVGEGTRPQEPTPIVQDANGRVIGNGTTYVFPSEVERNSPGVPHRFTITNGGTDPLNIIDLRIGSNNFFMTEGEGATTTLDSGESLPFEITMETSPAGSKSGIILFDSNALPSRWAADLEGTVTEADISGFRLEIVDSGQVVTPGSILEFPETVAHTENVIGLRWVNESPLPVRAYSYRGLHGFDIRNQPFSVFLDPGQYYDFQAVFDPSYEGDFSSDAGFRLEAEVGGEREFQGYYPVALVGTALPSSGDSRLQFQTASGVVIPNGAVFEVGQGRPYERLEGEIRLVNISTEIVEIGGWRTTDNLFGVEPWQPPATLDPGESLPLQISLGGTKTAESGIYTEVLYNELVDVKLKAVVGAGVTLERDGIEIAPDAMVNFPQTTAPVSTTADLTLRNRGFEAVAFDGVTLDQTGAFRILDPPAPQSLGPGELISFTVELEGAVPGVHLDALTIAVSRLDGTDATFGVGLRGWVWPNDDPSPLLEVGTSSDWDESLAVWHGETLPTKEIGPSSAEGLVSTELGLARFDTQSDLSIRNNGDAPLEILEVRSAGAPGLQSNVNYRGPDILDPGESSEISAYFLSDTPGEYLEEITIRTNDPFSPLTLKLPIKVVERSVMEVRSPFGVHSTGGTLDLGVLPRSVVSTVDVPVTVYNRGKSPLYITRRYTRGDLILGYWGQFPIRIEPGRSVGLGVETFLNSSTIVGELLFGTSDRGLETFRLRVRGTTSEDRTGTSPLLYVRGDFGLLPNDGPREVVGTYPYQPTSTEYFLPLYLHNIAPTNIASDGTLEIQSVTVEGDFQMSSLSTTMIPKGDRAILTMALSTDSPGRYDGRVTIRNNSPIDPYVANIRAVILADGPLAQVEDIEETPIPRGGTFDLGSVSAGSPKSRAFFVYNAGDAPFRLDDSGIQVEGSGFSVLLQPDAPTVIEPNEKALFRIRFVSQTTGDHAGTVTFDTSEGVGSYEFQLQVNVLSNTDGDLSVEPDVRIFRHWDGQPVVAGGVVDYLESIPTNEPTSRRFRIENHGGADLEISNPATLVSGTCFSQVEDPAPTVAAGDVTYFRVRLQCPTAGTRTGTVTVESNDADQPTFSFSVEGAVYEEQPSIAVYRNWDDVRILPGSTYTFDESTPTDDPISRRFRIENHGDADLVIGNPAAVVSGSCFQQIETSADTVPPEGVAYFRVRLYCATAGAQSGQVSISSNDPAVGSFAFGLSGTVDERRAEIAVAQAWDDVAVADGGTFSFPDSPSVGETLSRRFRIDNPGTADLVLANAVSLVDGACFSQIESPWATIPAGGSAYFRVRLGCSEAGPKTGTVTITPDDPAVAAYSFALEGTVSDPDPLITVRQGWDGAALAAGGLATIPGSHTLEDRATAGSFFLDNPGAAPLEILNSGTLFGGVCFQQDPAATVPSTIPAGGSVEVPFRVYCGSAGLATGSLLVRTSLDGVTVDGYYSASLEATVIEPELRVIRGWPEADPTEIVSGSTISLPVVAEEGDANTSVGFQVHNDGSGKLFLHNADASMVSGECFSIRSGGLPDPSVPASGMTSFRVWWGETCAPGEYTAAVTLLSSDADEDPLSFTVVGTVAQAAPELEVLQNWDLVAVADSATVEFPKAVSAGIREDAAFQVTNTGSETLSFDAGSGITGECYSIAPGEPIPTSLEPDATAIVRVRVECGTPGEQLGSLTLSTSSASQVYAPFSFTIRALVDAPEIRVVRGWPGADPAEIVGGESLRLPIVAVAGDTDTSVAFQIHNDGPGDLVIENPDTTLVSGTCFKIRNTEAALPSTPVGTGEMTVFRVWWGESCTTPGDYVGTVTVRSSDGDENPLIFEVVGEVVTTPGLTCEPQDARVVIGEAASFQVCTDETNGDVGYAWFKDGAALGVTTSSLSIGATTAADEGTYRVDVTNQAGTIASRSASLVVVEKPVVTRPTDQSTDLGGSATFSVSVESPSEDGPFTYRWQERPPGVSSFQNVSGGTSASLTISGATKAMDGTRYRCLVSNDAGQTNSYSATLSVQLGDVEVTKAWNHEVIAEGTSWSFGPVERGVAKSRLFRINNVGPGTLTLSNPESLVDGACFSQIESPASPSIAPGSYADFRVRFQCSTPGWHSAQITIQSDDPSSPYRFTLRGKIVVPEVSIYQDWDGALVGEGSTVYYPSVETGSAVSRRFRITNTGEATLTISNPTSLVSGTCWSQIENAASTVAPGASTYFRVRLFCSSSGTKWGTVAVNSDDPSTTYEFTVQGTVIAPSNVTVYRAWDGVTQSEGTTFTFPETETNTGESRRFKITNTGSGTLTISNPTSLVSGTCWSQIENAASTVAPGASTYFRVRLLCGTTGTKSGTVTIYSNDSSSPYRFYLTGNVVAPDPSDVTVYRAWDGVLQGDGSTFTFPNTTTSSPVSRRFRITNTGTGTLTISNPTSLVSGTCWSQVEDAASTVAPGGSTYFRVRLLCGTTGTKSGTITIQSNDPSSPYRFYVTGTVQ